MAKRKSNRAVRRLLCMPVWLSNRKQMSSWPSTINTVYFSDKVKPSRSQRRAKRLVEEMRIERHFEANILAGMNDDQAWAEAVRTIKG
ncbi:hypothetical protein IM876_09085 [Serratia plymuthica]|uniref:hypothetical protein n=1 Tax=Serratia plymuthica TaxID=82996 RepID=UPI001928E829|nr:hypothetical protein [Serratia plymuthica]MBL3522816.1 hypothetical protein [Serratia plymuthica]